MKTTNKIKENKMENQTAIKLRKYVVKNIDAEDEPIIKKGECPFYINDEDLVPDGFVFNSTQNDKNLKTVFVNAL